MKEVDLLQFAQMIDIIKNLAKRAGIKCSEEEIKRFEKDFDQIIKLIDRLPEVEEIEEVINPETMILENDKEVRTTNVDEVLAGAKYKEQNMYKIRDM